MNTVQGMKTEEAAHFAAGSSEEVFFAFHSTPAEDFAAEAGAALEKYADLQAECDCSLGTELMLRFHLRDITTQAPVLRRLLGQRQTFVSMIQQPPVDGAALAIEAYHLRAEGLSKSSCDQDAVHQLDVGLNNYRLLFHRRSELCPGADVEAQTTVACEALDEAIRARQGTLAQNCLRTWFYAHDIDHTYAGVVKGRREFFDTVGLTRNTHYIASTGIGGDCENPGQIVKMDALALFGIGPRQVTFMQALDHMPPTHVYNVTFERGTRVRFGDRSHYYLSGTASIDPEGQIMHPGDVRAQARRMAKNVDVLLGNHAGSLGDMKLAVVYIRNQADVAAVKAEIDTLFPASLPRIIVQAPVCRPGWLLEMDGIAINRSGDEQYPDFA